MPNYRTWIHFYVLWSQFQVNQSPERKPERAGMLSSLVSLITVSPQHRSPPPLTDQDPKHFKDIEWICAYPCAWCRNAGRWDMGEWGQGLCCDVYRPRSFGWGESSFLCRCKLTFICQGPIHKYSSFMIASGTSQMQWQMDPTKSTINAAKRNIFTWRAYSRTLS